MKNFSAVIAAKVFGFCLLPWDKNRDINFFDATVRIRKAYNKPVFWLYFVYLIAGVIKERNLFCLLKNARL